MNLQSTAPACDFIVAAEGQNALELPLNSLFLSLEKRTTNC